MRDTRNVSTQDDRLERLRNSEINFSISHFYDEGFHVKLGDKLNGWLDEMMVDHFVDAVSVLWQMAEKHFPDADCFQ